MKINTRAQYEHNIINSLLQWDGQKRTLYSLNPPTFKILEQGVPTLPPEPACLTWMSELDEELIWLSFTPLRDGNVLSSEWRVTVSYYFCRTQCARYANVLEVWNAQMTYYIFTVTNELDAKSTVIWNFE